MGKKFITFDNIEIEKNKFHRNKKPVFSKNAVVDNILISKRYSNKKNY